MGDIEAYKKPTLCNCYIKLRKYYEYLIVLQCSLTDFDNSVKS